MDTKPVELIVDEFANSPATGPLFYRLSNAEQAVLISSMLGVGKQRRHPSRKVLSRPMIDMRVLAEKPSRREEWSQEHGRYPRFGSLSFRLSPYEILHWRKGGRHACSKILVVVEERDVSLDGFVAFWFRKPRPFSGIYDFFLLKVERFVGLSMVAPELQGIAEERPSFGAPIVLPTNPASR